MKKLMILVVSLGLVACANPTTAGETEVERISKIGHLATTSEFVSVVMRDSETGCKYLIIESLRRDQSGMSVLYKENGEPDCGLTKD